MDDRVRIHKQIVSPIESRFDRLRELLPTWNACSENVKQQVLNAFEKDDISTIKQLMETHHMFASKVKQVESFLLKWDPAATKESTSKIL